MPVPGRPKPIRYDLDTWLVMRNDPVIPKAVIGRVHTRQGDRYFVFRWELDPAKRELVSLVDSLEKADDLVLYDPAPRDPKYSAPPNGRRADGTMWQPPAQ
jgi:hypothetical protein